MDTQDRQAIEGLFNRLQDVDRAAPPRDAEADALIKDRVAGHPGAPYLMAQTIVMQDHALGQAQARIEELEREAAQRPAGGGGFLSGLFGAAAQPARPAVREPMGAPMGAPMNAAAGSAGQPWPAPQQGRGGGFLAGAAQTAMGVAGGVLIGNAIGSMFGGDEAKAAEAPAQTAAAEPKPEAEEKDDDGGWGLFGGDDGEEA